MTRQRNDEGSMLLAIGFTTVLLLIASAITATVIASASSTSVSLNRAESRQELKTAMSWVQRRWFVVPVIKEGSPNPDPCFRQTFAGSRAASVTTNVAPRGNWEFCFAPDRQPGEGPYESVVITAKVETAQKTRYYEARATGIAGTTLQPAGGMLIQPIDDRFGAGWGFSTGTGISAGGTGTTLTSYSVSTTATEPGVPMAASSYKLGTANPGRSILWRNSDGPGAGTCSGTGCSASDLRNHWASDNGVPFGDPPPSCDPDPLTWPTWRSTQAPTPGVLSTPAEGACFRHVIFDRDTTVTGNAYLWVREAVRVDDNRKVNITGTKPDARKLRISSPQSAGDGLHVGAGAQIAAVASRSQTHCILESGSTWYGSLACGDYIEAEGANLRFQLELREEQQMTDRFGYARNIGMAPYNWDSIRFQQVTKAEAGY